MKITCQKVEKKNTAHNRFSGTKKNTVEDHILCFVQRVKTAIGQN